MTAKLLGDTLRGSHHSTIVNHPMLISLQKICGFGVNLGVKLETLIHNLKEKVSDLVLVEGGFLLLGCCNVHWNCALVFC